MANYNDMFPTFVSADNEQALQKKLRDLALASGKLIRPLSVYPKGSKIFCWFVLDIKSARLAVEKNDTVKKVVKKKTIKK